VPGAFWTVSTTAGLPPSAPVPRFSAGPSRTSATSPMVTGAPSWYLITVPAMSSTTAHAAALADGHLQRVDIRQIAGAERAVGLARGVHDIRDREVVQAQLLLLDEHLVLRQLAADDRDLGDAGDRQQLVAQVELGVGAQLRSANAAVGRRHRQQHDLAGDGRDRRHLGVRVGRQVLAHGVESLGDELAGAVDVHVPQSNST
jgi:hypothetical protein